MQTILMTLIGLLLGVLYSIGGLFVDLFSTGLNKGSLLAMGALWAMPILAGLVGCALGLLQWILYLLFSQFINIRLFEIFEKVD